MKSVLFVLTALLFLSACEPRDLRLLQDSERSKKGFYSKGTQEIFFGDTSAAIFALEKQIEIINALEMNLHHESAADSGYIFSDESKSSNRNSSPAYIFHQYQNLVFEKTRQEALLQWRTSVSAEPLVLQGLGSVALYLNPPPEAKVIQSPVADIKANIEKQDVVITTDSTDKNIFNIKVTTLKITLSKDMGKPFLTEVNIDSEMTVRRETTNVGAPARYTVIKAALNLNNNKARNGDPVRTLTMGLSDQFSIFLGTCPYSLGTLSLISNGASKDLVQLKEKSILNLSSQAEDALINCNETSVRPFVDLSRLLRM